MEGDALLKLVQRSIIGEGVAVPGPYGARRLTYADYTASGRSLSFVEDFIRDCVLPWYANTHNDSSATAAQINALREEARTLIRSAVGGDDSTVVIFTGSGCTGAIDKLINILGLRIPAALRDDSAVTERPSVDDKPVVFIGPYEHHSNELLWRESTCDVVVIPEDASGRPSLEYLRTELVRHSSRSRKIGSFSAASNVTGIVTPTDEISDLLHAHGALAFWDYAAAAPHGGVRMFNDHVDHPLSYKDAVFISPHKFMGGPGTPGVLLVRRDLLTNRVPSVPGGGTVEYVSASEHHYIRDAAHREEGGTPAIVESIRAGLVFSVQQAVGAQLIHEREQIFLHRALKSWSSNPDIDILGNLDVDRLAIVSMLIRGPNGRHLHHNFVVTLLSDLFGIQARGGCSCAGPYGHRLLRIGVRDSNLLKHAILDGMAGVKPGWLRMSFSYTMSEAVVDYIIEAVHHVATSGWKLLGDYDFDPTSGTWRHSRSSAPQVKLADMWGISSASSGAHGCVQMREDGMNEHLEEATRIFSNIDNPSIGPSRPLTGDIDILRWFERPAQRSTLRNEERAALDITRLSGQLY